MQPDRSRLRRWQGVGLSAVGAMIVATAIIVVAGTGSRTRHEEPDAAGTRLIAGGYFEASGVVHVPGSRQLLFVDDDRPRELFVVEINDSGAQRTSAVAVPLGAHVTDPEGLTHDGRYFYVVGSQSKAFGAEGDGLVRFSYDPERRRVSNVEAMRNLKNWLADNVPELRDANDGVGDHLLNIEGLAWDQAGRRLLLGLRAPVIGDTALIVPLKLIDSTAAMSAGNLRVDGAVIRLLLQGDGIRSIEFDQDAQAFVLITGASLNEETREFRVLEWKAPSDSVRVVATFIRTLKPEGVTRANIGRRSMRVLIFDTGRLTTVD